MKACFGCNGEIVSKLVAVCYADEQSIRLYAGFTRFYAERIKFRFKKMSDGKFYISRKATGRKRGKFMGNQRIKAQPA